MGSIFAITLEQILILFVFILIGWLLKHFNIVEKGAARNISKLEMWVFMPALIIKSFSSNFTVEQLSSKMTVLLAGIIVTAVTFVIALWLGKVFGTDKLTKNIYAYSFVIPNTSYVGYPLALAVFGEVFQCDFITFTLPMWVLMYTWGMFVLTGQEKISFKTFNNPTIWSLVIGIALGLLGVKIPEMPMTIITNASNCMAPCAMLLAGIVLGKQSLKAAFGNGRAYVASLIRLIAIPAVVCAIMMVLKVDTYLIQVTGMVLCMPMGLNSIVFPESMGQDSSAGASTVIISHVMGIVTIPLVTMLLYNLQ